MKRNKQPDLLWLFLGLMLLPLGLQAQVYGNEWINYNQQYLKIPVGQEGMYKVTYQDLQAAGFPVNAVNPRNLQLFHRGKEQAVFVEGESNNIFDPQDYLLFYGRKNDGSQDKELYISPEAQPHTYYNLYSDTTAYFLTFNLTNQAGKRMVLFSENNTYNLSPEPYHLEERRMLFTSNYSGGMAYLYGGRYLTQLAYGDYGEGYTGPVVSNGQTQDILFENLNQQAAVGPEPELEILLAGRNNIEREIEILAGATPSALQPVHTASFSGARHYLLREPLSRSQLSGGQSVARIATSQGERVSVSYAKLTYPRNWNMEGAYEKVFNLAPTESDRRYIELQNVPGSVLAYDVSDPDNVSRIGLRRVTTSTVSAVLRHGTSARKLFFSGIHLPVSGVKKIQFRQLNPKQANYLIVSHPALRTQAAGYADPLKAYAEYRASAAGGGFDTLLMNVGALYDQFSYGEINPLAIRRLAAYIASEGDPQYLFLLGKALDVYYNYYRDVGWTNQNHDLVPTFGFPGADVPFTAHINGSGHAPAFPVGRLGARTAQEVANYLNKVKEMEGQVVTDLSRKNLVHLSGGINKSQSVQFKYYLSEFQRTAEGPFLGGKVETVSKTEDVVVQEIDIARQVNSGVGLITFFGHSSPSSTDIEIGYVSDERSGYRNKGKYPCMLVNGCDAGDIFTVANRITFGEDWMFAADKGAISVIAHSGTGYSNLLRNYSDLFYQVGYGDSLFIDASTGKIQLEAVTRFLEKTGINEPALAHAHEMVLQGDPAVKLFGMGKPDFETNGNNLFLSSFNNGPISLAADSFALAIIVRNFGRTQQDSLSIKVSSSLNEGAGSDLGIQKFVAPYYQDTLYYTIRPEDLKGAGLYRFEVRLNPGSQISETNFTNNTGVLEVFLNSGGTINLLPHNYSIVQENELDLYFQGTNLFAKNRKYVLELDTSAGFSSLARQQFNITADALVKQRVSLPQISNATSDTLVYFWRSRLADKESNEDTSWVASSFTYIKDSRKGWSQSHREQFREDELEGLSVDNAKQWAFNDLSRNIKVVTFGAAIPEGEVEVSIDGVNLILYSSGRVCTANSMNAIHFDRANLEAMITSPYGSNHRVSCGTVPQVINNFIEPNIIYGNNDEYNLEKYLTEIPEGDYVLLFSIGNVNYEQWPPSVIDQVVSLGADPEKLAALTNGEPFILIGQKGGTTENAKAVYADKRVEDLPAIEQTIQLEHALEGKKQPATIESRLIGPAREWQELAFNLQMEEGDEFELQVMGLNLQLEEQLLFTLKENTTLPLEMDAAQFPYLKLKLRLQDRKHLTPAQLEYWQVSYLPLPEGILLPAKDLQKQYTFDEGQDFEPAFRFINISGEPFTDSLRVDYSFFNMQERSSFSRNKKIMAPAPSDTSVFTYKVNTDGQAGHNNLKVQVNPRLVPETYYNNNVLDLKDFFVVRKDTIQPMVDVAFDGVYISNGAIVSPTPYITILLRDQNKHKLKQDTTGIHIYLKKECEGCEFERVNLGGAEARWKAASGEEDFRIEFQPQPLDDGIYTLQVQGEDASRNKAGEKPFSISFEVVTESSVTNFYPYPNPFSTATRFVFTLTGSQIPDDIKIQIMTVDGRIVREVLKEEIGPLQIGHNISQFAWDGRDEWGDQLANGVYLYKVYLRHSGDAFEHRETKGDKSFRKGFGKLYLLR